jgi:hypothetical protein
MAIFLRISWPAKLSCIVSYFDRLITYAWARRVGADPELMQLDGCRTDGVDRTPLGGAVIALLRLCSAQGFCKGNVCASAFACRTFVRPIVIARAGSKPTHANYTLSQAHVDAADTLHIHRYPTYTDTRCGYYIASIRLASVWFITSRLSSVALCSLI